MISDDVHPGIAAARQDLAETKRRHEGTRRVLADREAELLEVKGPCRVIGCRLHLAHRGPCHICGQPVAVHPPNN